MQQPQVKHTVLAIIYAEYSSRAPRVGSSFGSTSALSQALSLLTATLPKACQFTTSSKLAYTHSSPISPFLPCPDFGFALRVDSDMARTPCGSYSYAAPELFTANGGTYDGKKADVWSL